VRRRSGKSMVRIIHRRTRFAAKSDTPIDAVSPVQSLVEVAAKALLVEFHRIPFAVTASIAGSVSSGQLSKSDLPGPNPVDS
jgi:hypothetical protein